MDKNNIKTDIRCVLQGDNKLSVINNSAPISYVDKKELLDIAEDVDKIDLFDHLLIEDESYLKRSYVTSDKKNIEFGIELDKNIHYTNCPILPHQRAAVQKFLRDFRGVGILADEVGMGKTIESGMIISELAERQLANSILFVAASEKNLEDWIQTMHEKFGLDGIKVISTMTDIRDNCDKDGKPLCPLIMLFDDFCELDIVMPNNYLFDIIVVDEAHNFDNSDKGKKGMINLRNFMVKKRQCNKPYCILISGTPHKGNLDSMFPLWFFIRGGKDEDAAKKYYKEFLCNGASTIAEFIESFRINELNNNEDYGKFVHEKVENYKKKRSAVLDKVAISGFIKSQSYEFRREFLDYNQDVKRVITQKTNKAYKSLLNSFMIRQSRNAIGRSAKKTAYNYYFLPVDNNSKTVDIIFQYEYFDVQRMTLTVDYTNFDGNEAITYEGKSMSFDDFFDAHTDARRKKNKGDRLSIKNVILFSALEKAGAFIENDISSANRFICDKSYYQDSFTYAKTEKEVDWNRENNTIITMNLSDNVFKMKAEKFAEIVRSEKYNDKQIIVFFDYYTEGLAQEDRKLYKYLEKYPDVQERIILCDNEGDAADIFSNCKKDMTPKEIAQSKNGILFSNEKLSESSNFQFCNVIFNFTICFSPIKMDQRIGRIDRIGQMKDMDVISFGTMNKLDGYVLSFFNEIKLFSGWKDDIILVTGCDNKNSVTMKCRECGKIIRCFEGQTDCPSCTEQGTLSPLENNISFRCPNCSFSLLRSKSGDNNKGYSYMCNKEPDKKLYLSKDTSSIPVKEYIVCDKLCAIAHCESKNKANCEVYKNMNTPGLNLNDFLDMCDNCESPICSSCKVSIDVLGIDILTHEFAELSCQECPSRSQGCSIINIDRAKPICPKCHTELAAVVPSTFDEFVESIWKEESFIKAFSYESNKIKDIVDTLKWTQDDVE